MKKVKTLIVLEKKHTPKQFIADMEKHACNVVGTVPTAEAAVTLINKKSPDIILLSYNIFYNVTEEIRTSLLDALRGIPLLLIIGKMKSDYQAGFDLDIEPYGLLHLPIHTQATATMIHIALKRHENVQAAQRISNDSQARLDAVVANSSTGIYLIDEHFHFEYVNDRLCEILGRDRSEIIGQPFTKFLGKSKDKVVKRYHERLSGKEVPSEYDLDIVRKSGEVRDLQISASTFIDTAGNTKSTGHLLDITQQKKNNTELNKLGQALDQSPVMTMITDIDGNIEYINTEFIKSTGYTTEDLIGKNPRLLKTGIHDKAFYKDMWDTITKGYIWSGEISNRLKNGRISWQKASIAPIRNRNKQITHFVAVKEDITDYKKELEAASKSQHLRDIQYEITSAAIRAKDASALYEKIYQYISEIIKSSNFFMAMLSKEDNQIHFPFDRDSFKSKMPDSIPYTPEKSLTAKTIATGKTIHLMSDEIISLAEKGQMGLSGDIPSVWLGIPLKVNNDVIGAFVIQEYYGITKYDEDDIQMLELAAGQVAITIDRARKDDALRELADELRHTNDMKELLLDVITHDLRNPAGVIKTIADVLSAERNRDELINALQGSSTSLLKVIENATVLSRINTGESIFKDPLDLVEVINDVVAEYDAQLTGARMTLTIKAPKSLVISANPIISEIIKNYLSNAIKYGIKGQEIKVSLRKVKDKVVFQMDDKSKPIPKDMRTEIFQRFTRLEGEKKSGRGLGLAIVKRIADAHEAEVGVKTSPEGGNSFYLKF